MQVAAIINGVHYSDRNIPNKTYEVTDFDSITEKAERFQAIVDSPAKIEMVKELVPSGLYAYFTDDGYALISHSEATKINALSAILQFWDISFEETVAFGDAGNDIDMLTKCGIGVTPENARDEIKAIADECCDNCDSDGVAKWLERHVLGSTPR